MREPSLTVTVIDVGFPLKRVRYVSDTRDYKDPAAVWHFSVGYPF